MSWPRFRLTPNEKKYNAKYDAPGGKPHVLRRIYPGFLELTNTVRSPSYQLQIARKSKVLAFTASGDLEEFLVQFSNVSGEQYLSEPMTPPLLLGGWFSI